MKKRKILITAGSTIIPIDQVRAISNIFKGRTGTKIAEHFAEEGEKVTLITSDPKLVKDNSKVKVIAYRTYDDLARLMEEEIRTGNYDLLIHSAAVSDYKVEGVFLLDEEGAIAPLDAANKVSSKHEELFLKLTPTKKIVDLIREPWGFKGKLVKFKLEVGITDEELIEIGKKSMAASDADFIVVNCLEWSSQYAYILDREGGQEKISRKQLANELLRRTV